VYGPLVGRAIELAREHTPLVAATGALDAMEDAEEVIIGLRESDRDQGGDVVMVVRGVRANVDPANIVDEAGRALWAPSPNALATNVRELLRTPAEAARQGAGVTPDASLFELPGRTWVIATGGARARARDAFARPAAVASDPLGVPSSALAVLRLKGPSLVTRVRALRPPGLLAPLGRSLATATVVLTPGEDAAIRATLLYNDEQAVALAQATIRETLDALFRAKPDDYAWLRSVGVQASRCCIVVTTPLPRQFLMNEERSPDPAAPPAGPAGELRKDPQAGGASSKIPL
jgi:hypothetical protein